MAQKTYKGRSAYSYVRTARALQMRSGSMEVVADNECHLRIVGDGTISMRDASGLVVVLTASEAALKKLDALEAEC